MEENEFLRPMLPYPGLEKYAQSIKLTNSGLRLFYYDAGEKETPAIILVHGLGDEADTWRYLIEPLSANRRVIAPDLPGFGRSDKPHIKYTIEFYTQILLEFIDQLEIKCPLWIGNSLGAILSQSVALQSPERVQGLVLIDGSMLQSSSQKVSLTQFLFLLPGTGKWLYNRLRKNPQAAYGSLRPYYNDLDALPEEEQKFLHMRVNQRVWDDQQRDAYLSILRNMVFFFLSQQSHIKESVPQLKMPTLIIWGENDQIYSIENGRLLESILPTARLVTFPQTGHLVQQERPQELLNTLLVFCQG